MDARFELVTAAHHFLIKAIPLDDPRTLDALTEFIQKAAAQHLPSGDVDAVLLRTLSVLHPHCGTRVPSLVDSYLALRHQVTGASPLACFEACVRNVLRFRGIGSPIVRNAIVILDARFGDGDLRQSTIAKEIGVSPSVLSGLFKEQTGLTFTEYLQAMRLDRAAAMLADSPKSIKEIWVDVGYNHASNFNHDFKRRFGLTPGEYRAQAVHSSVRDVQPADAAEPPASDTCDRRDETILVVDDDEGTRDTLQAYLGKLLGFTVVTAATGEAGVREAMRLRPRAILLDYQLPDIDGISCLRILARERWGSRRPSVILFTADWTVEEREAEVRALGGSILSKLCELEEVGRAIYQLPRL